jgi:sulfite dehydrogenase
LSLRRLAIAAAVAFGAAAAAEDNQLVSGPGVGLVNAKCATCHDVTHITRSKLTRDEWTDNFANMVSRGMPPATDAERAIIIDYLVAYYGPNPAPPPSADTLADAAAKATGIDVGDQVGKLLSTNGCTACHAVDKPLVGPPFKAIADRYRSDGGAAARLAAKVRQGGAGVWGQTPMPPNATLSDPELKQVVDWVLGRK